MNITKINASISDSNHLVLVVSALLAAFKPFGSLTEGVDSLELAANMMAWVTAPRDARKILAGVLVELVSLATTEQHASIELGDWEVALRTPTSGTKIRLRRYSGGYDVEVDFGSKGSKSRAMEILAAAEQAGVKFDAYRKDKQLPRTMITTALLCEADRMLDYYRRLTGTGYYDEAHRTTCEVRAAKNLEFFAALE